jgi:hypothetical protein
MDSCHSCGATLSVDAQWCGQCFALPHRAGPAGSGAGTTSVLAPIRTTPTATLPPTVVTSRWRKTATTFGPVGRILATIALVVPCLFLIVVGVLTGGLELGAAFVWGLIVMPWGLRDTWRAGQLTVE